MLLMKPMKVINAFKAEVNEDKRVFENLKEIAKEYDLDITKDSLSDQFIKKYGANNHGYKPSKVLDMKGLDSVYEDIQELRKNIKYYKIMLHPNKEQEYIENNIYMFTSHPKAIVKAKIIYDIRDQLLSIDISRGLINDMFFKLGMNSNLELNPYNFEYYHGWHSSQQKNN